MSQPETKILTFPIKLGKVKLSFTKINNEWVCYLNDEFMADLENALDNKIPDRLNPNKVRWVDIPDLGPDSGTNL